jgi:hypothetical protein
MHKSPTLQFYRVQGQSEVKLSSKRSFDGTKDIRCSSKRESSQVEHHRHTTAGFYIWLHIFQSNLWLSTINCRARLSFGERLGPKTAAIDALAHSYVIVRQVEKSTMRGKCDTSSKCLLVTMPTRRPMRVMRI